MFKRPMINKTMRDISCPFSARDKTSLLMPRSTLFFPSFYLPAFFGFHIVNTGLEMTEGKSLIHNGEKQRTVIQAVQMKFKHQLLCVSWEINPQKYCWEPKKE